MPFFIDYKEEVKKLISESYIPADSFSKEFEMTTELITENFLKVLPRNSIDEHLVYEALVELGFQPKENSPLEYLWYFQRL
jgi:ubiquinone biosynthesis protein COQ9